MWRKLALANDNPHFEFKGCKRRLGAKTTIWLLKLCANFHLSKGTKNNINKNLHTFLLIIAGGLCPYQSGYMLSPVPLIPGSYWAQALWVPPRGSSVSWESTSWTKPSRGTYHGSIFHLLTPWPLGLLLESHNLWSLFSCPVIIILFLLL